MCSSLEKQHIKQYGICFYHHYYIFTCVKCQLFVSLISVKVGPSEGKQLGIAGPFTLVYKDICSLMPFIRAQEFVLVMLHSYSALTNRQNITICHVLK